MSFSPIPKITAPDIYKVTPAFLHDRGVTLLLMDLDNTLSPYSEHSPPEKLLAWMAKLKAAGIELFIVSNNRSKTRARDYAAACGIPFIRRAGKPSPRSLRAAMAQMGRHPNETALIGDQVFTDGLAANRAGVLSIVVKPLHMKSVLFYLRYIIEQPFRLLSKEKIV